MNVPFLSFTPQHAPIREEILAAIADVYDKQWYVLGDQVRAFEAAYAEFNHV